MFLVELLNLRELIYFLVHIYAGIRSWDFVVLADNSSSCLFSLWIEYWCKIVTLGPVARHSCFPIILSN